MEPSSTASAVAARSGLRPRPILLDRHGLIATVLVIAATVVISIAAAGEVLLALLIFGGVVLCGVLLVSDRYQITLALLALYLGLVDGYVKLKLNTSWATLGRDALLYAIVAGAFARAAVRRERIEVPPLTGWVLAFCAVVLVQVFNPANGSWSHSIAAVRPHLEFVPLFFLGYWTMRSKARLRGFLMLLLLIAAVNGVVSFLQFNMSPEQFASWGPGYNERIYGTNNISGRSFLDGSGELQVRPFGLGGDAGFGGIVGMLAVPAGLALVLARGRGRPLLIGLTLVLAAGAAAGVITSQARVAVVSSVLAALAFGILASVSRRVVGTLIALAVAAGVAFATVSLVTGGSDTQFRAFKTITPNRVVETTYNYRRDTLAQVPEYAVDYPLGAGIGGTGPAGGYGGPTRGDSLNAESEPTYLLIELGIPGLLVLLGFNLQLFTLALRRTQRLADIELRLLLAAVIAPLFAVFGSWIVGIATASTPTAPYFWFVAGIAAYWLAENTRQAPAPAAPVRFPLRSRRARRRAVDAHGPAPVPAPRAESVDQPPPRAAEPYARAETPATASEIWAVGIRISLLYRDTGTPVDGIRDYARELSNVMASRGADVSLDLIRGHEIPPEAARADVIVLQYNPFAYGRWGFAPWLPSALGRLGRQRPRPIIAVMVHEPFMPLSGGRKTLMGWWQRLQLAALRRTADVTFVSIEQWVGAVRRWGPAGPIHQIPAGSPLPDMRSQRVAARAELGVGEETIVMAAFGTGHPSRLMDRVSASARRLHESGHELVLLNLGAGAPALVGVPDSVRVEAPGLLEPAALARRLSAADLFVAPFIDGVSSRRTTFVAALQHGLPVVSTDGPLTDDLLRSARWGCRLVPVGDTDRFTAAVAELAARPDERERLGHGARVLYESEFAWPVIADRVLVQLRDAFLQQLRKPPVESL